MTRKNLIAITAVTLLAVPASLAGIGEVQPADPTRVSPLFDVDHDGMVSIVDNCPFTFNPDQADADGDGTGDACDTTPWSPGGGTDGQLPGCDILNEGECGDTDPEN